MNLDSVRREIEAFLLNTCKNGEKSRPLVVNTDNIDQLTDLKAHFHDPNARSGDEACIMKASSCSMEDFLPAVSDVMTALGRRRRPTVCTEWTTFLKFEGRDELRNVLCRLLDETFFSVPVVVLCYQCSHELDTCMVSDLRRQQRIRLVDGPKTALPSMTFIMRDFKSDILLDRGFYDESADGIDNVAECVETMSSPNVSSLGQFGIRKILVRTARSAEAYPNSCFSIEAIDSSYKVLIKFERALSQFPKSAGTEAQWNWLLNIAAGTSFGAVLEKQLGVTRDRLDDLSHYMKWSDNERWLYFLALRLWKSGNVYLDEVIANMREADSFIRMLYRRLAVHKFGEPNFQMLFRLRRQLIVDIDAPIEEIENYCSSIASKKSVALYYLTDHSRYEKELCLSLLHDYGIESNKTEMLNILKVTYPKLYEYIHTKMTVQLAPGIDQEKIYQYFEQYRYQKAINKIFDDFKAIVCAEAVEYHTYNRFSHRRAHVERLCKAAKNQDIATKAWFVDALGVEFIPYIHKRCKELKLEIKSEIHSAFLPTLTKYNTEFREDFAGAGIAVVDFKEIDKLKHEKLRSVEFDKTKIPVHLIDELDFVDTVLDQISKSLKNGDIRRAVIISDHGASRLAVIADDAEVIDVEARGEHAGRICDSCSGAAGIPCAVRGDMGDCCVMAGYARFKGGMPAEIEVHGGATLEETLVPICEIELPCAELNNVEIKFNTEEIKVGPRKCAEFELYALKKVRKLSIEFPDGRRLIGETADHRSFRFSCDWIKRAGSYTFDVYADGQPVYRGMSFKTVSQGMQSSDDDFF